MYYIIDIIEILNYKKSFECPKKNQGRIKWIKV